MKIHPELKVREMAGEQVVIMPGRAGVDMTKVLSLNASSLYLWEALRGEEFDTQRVADLIVENYKVDNTTALKDAQVWVERLAQCGVLI